MGDALHDGIFQYVGEGAATDISSLREDGVEDIFFRYEDTMTHYSVAFGRHKTFASGIRPGERIPCGIVPRIF